MTQEEMLELLEKEYLAKILGFSYRKTGREEAEDLASDIVVEVMKYIRSGRHVENFNALVWSISNHIFCKRLREKKRGTTAYMQAEFPAQAGNDVEGEILRLEQENLLHREVSMLSEKYRKTIVLYYFEGRSCEETARMLGVKSGTVKWWLHEARSAIKEGIDMNREYGERSYRPQGLCMSCRNIPGADNEPMSCAKRKIAQNILLAAYQKPLTVLELSIELGISAPYMEDEVRSLVQNQLMRELPGGKFQTDFVILPAANLQVKHRIYERCFPEYFDRLIEILERNRERLCAGNLNSAGFSWDRLLWVYLHIVTDRMLDLFQEENCLFPFLSDIPIRPNGGRWIALGWIETEPSDMEAQTKTWKAYLPGDGPVHKLGRRVQGYFHHWNGADSSVFFDIPDELFILCGKIIKKELAISKLTEDEKYLFGIAIERKLFLPADAQEQNTAQDGSAFRQNFYFADREADREIEILSRELYPAVRKYFAEAWKIILAAFEPGIPRHLSWQMGYILSNYLQSFVTCALYEAMGRKLLSQPDENSREWLSLYMSEN